MEDILWKFIVLPPSNVSMSVLTVIVIVIMTTLQVVLLTSGEKVDAGVTRDARRQGKFQKGSKAAPGGMSDVWFVIATAERLRYCSTKQ